MSDDLTTSGDQIAQRGFPRFPRGRFPGRFTRGRFPGRFPRRFPIRRRFPGPIFPIFPGPIIHPPFFGFPVDRCFYIDRYGRCCDRFGRCCDRWGRCVYTGGYPFAGADTADDSWYGVAGGWDMMPDIDDMVESDMDSVAAFSDYVDYDD